MKILFDHTLFYQVYGGASKYFMMLMKYLPQGSWDTTALCSFNEYVKANHLMKHTCRKKFIGQGTVFNLINKPYTKYRVNKKDYDVLHQTDFDHYFYKQLGDKPLVVTYHDSNYLTYFPQPERVKLQRIALKRADAIIAVSENTKKDLLKYFDVDEKKVHVIYHGIEIKPLKNTVQSLIEGPYILYVGWRAGYKNFKSFSKAFALYHAKFPNVKLVFTSLPFSKEEIELFNKLNIRESVINIPATEEQMANLYHNALFFVYPSLYEGFGMPILEAWASQCPVALSNTSCFPEICGDAGQYFNPYEIENIESSMVKLTEDESLRHELIERGNKRVKLFSWNKCAEKHEEVYKSLI